MAQPLDWISIAKPVPAVLQANTSISDRGYTRNCIRRALR
jgi:hypothetical protein